MTDNPLGHEWVEQWGGLTICKHCRLWLCDSLDADGEVCDRRPDVEDETPPAITIEQLQKKNAELQKERDELNASNIRLLRSLTARNAEVDQLEKDAKALMEDRDGAEEQVRQAKIESRDRTRERDGFKSAHDLILKGMESQAEICDGLKQKSRKLETENASLRERVEIERESCAKECDRIYREYGEAVRITNTHQEHEVLKICARVAGICAAAIRAKGTDHVNERVGE